MNTVKILADSLHPEGNKRLVTFELRYWRALHSELMTHRVFSRNAGSSRAIPIKTVLKQVWNNPAGPTHWGRNRPGMQAQEELTGWRKSLAKGLWKLAGRLMCVVAWAMMKVGLHKQVANRILEPWQYINVVLSSTEWDNFFELRAHKDAQPEFQELARTMKFVMEQSVPRRLEYGEWHLPYIQQQDWGYHAPDYLEKQGIVADINNIHEVLKKISTARVARVSYAPFNGDASYEREIKRHDMLVGSRPIHASPTEHIASPIQDTEKTLSNFKGFFQYRHQVETNQQ